MKNSCEKNIAQKDTIKLHCETIKNQQLVGKDTNKEDKKEKYYDDMMKYASEEDEACKKGKMEKNVLSEKIEKEMEKNEI